MRAGPIRPARVGRHADGMPVSLDHGDIYHPRAGAFAQARHVFLAGNGLPERWRGRARFVIAETGFGLGNNFLATWAAWREDCARCERLIYLSVEQHPLIAEDLAAMHRDSPTPALAAALVAAWPPATPDLHLLDFDGGRVRLMLALGDISAWLPALHAEVDAFFLDGFAPARNPSAWEPRAFQAMARLAAPGATAATWTAARAVRDQLAEAGFCVERAEGSGGKRDITLARFEPRFVPARPPARRAAPAAAQAERRALVLGAGLAGCATAAALAAEGWHATVVDRRPAPALEASGNPAGLFHSLVHAGDGLHARLHRAAALLTHRLVAAGLAPAEDGLAPAGAAGGLLRLETTMTLDAMRAVLQRLGLPASHVDALDPAAASALAGLPLRHAAWWHQAGGWVRPGELARTWLAQAGAACRFIGGREVAAVHPLGGRWQAIDAHGVLIAEAPVLVLANAADASRLLAPLGLPSGACPVDPVRGQLSWLAADEGTGLPAPALPLVGQGYLLPPVDGARVFGATSQPGDSDGAVRIADHRDNLARLSGLSPALAAAADWPTERVQGRTAWRAVSRDRLPLIGAVPEAWVGGTAGAWDQPRFVPRAAGLYLYTGLGSRGITLAALGARLLAGMVTGGPLPLSADLVDALDPARFVTRANRRAAAMSTAAAQAQAPPPGD